MRVLAVVDDHPDVRSLVRLLFERAGASVEVEAATMAEAMTRLDAAADGVVVLDHQLDGGSLGLDGARLLRAKAPGARIILFTAAVMPPGEAREAGVDAIVAKDRILELVGVARDLLAAGEDRESSPLDAILVAWLARPALVFGSLPPPLQASVVLDALSPDAPLDRSLDAVSAFVNACGDVDVAVAHLLGLRRLLDGESSWRAAVDVDALDVLVVEATRRVLAEARRAGMVDPLTHLGNRAALEVELTSALARAERTGGVLSLVYFDLVGLKAINDRLGHAAGDAALQRFAAALVASKRAGDGAYRVGGDEFIAVLPDTPGEDADAFVERIEARGAPSFSWGLASAGEDGFEKDRLIRLADLRMLHRRYQRGHSVRPEATVDDDVIVVVR